MELCNRLECTGCGACYNICPQNAIIMEKNVEGFIMPTILEKDCNERGLCIKVCPVLNPIVLNRIKPKVAFAAWNKDEKMRAKSSSGGIFGILSNIIIRDNGVVFGAAFNNKFEVVHIVVNDLVQLDRLRKSKYVQSDIKDTFKRVKEFLNNKQKILFSGTPCQIAGLYGFLGREYDNLLTCDFVCHGVPSPGVFKTYLKYIEEKHNSKITEFNFKYKKNNKSQNIEIKFKSGGRILISEPLHDPYFYGFASGIFLRNSCYRCKYIGVRKISDITLGDFWGLSKDLTKKDKLYMHPSLVLINSKKGYLFFNKIKNNIIIFKRPIKEAIDGNLNLRRSTRFNIKRTLFFRDYKDKPFQYLVNKYLTYKFSFRDFIKKILGNKLTKIIGNYMSNPKNIYYLFYSFLKKK